LDDFPNLRLFFLYVVGCCDNFAVLDRYTKGFIKKNYWRVPSSILV
jgi:hypothetical protein